MAIAAHVIQNVVHAGIKNVVEKSNAQNVPQSNFMAG
jgi:hypothetical protein